MNQEKIGLFIKSKRKEKLLTQEQLAEKLGVSSRSISKWENGVCMPDISLYGDICNILSISLTEFILGEEKNDKIELRESDKSIESIINNSNNNNVFNRIIMLYAIFSLITSILLFLTSNNGIYLLIMSLILLIFLSWHFIKKSFYKIKKSNNIFRILINILSFLTFSVYIFWIHSTILLLISILLLLLIIYLSIKNFGLESIFYIIIIILFYALVIVVNYYFALI